MKKISISIITLCLFTLCSCSDFLETESLNNKTVESFYKTPDDAHTALVGCYDGVQAIWSGGVSFPVASEVLSDNAFGGTGSSDAFDYQMLDQFDKSKSPSAVNLFETNWENYYKAIYRINMLLANIDKVDWGTDATTKVTYEAEARFLRAFMYFDMARLWGSVPLLLEVSAENLPQASAQELYAAIATDLKFAAENLPSTNYASQAFADHGRVTKWAAESLMGRVYLYYTGYYGASDLAGVVTKAQALAYLEDVIANSGHGLLDEFKTLWPAASVDKTTQVNTYAGEDNKETVFAIKYSYTSSYATGNDDGNKWLVMLGVRTFTSYPYSQGWGGATVNPRLWQAFAATDTRRVASIISIADEGIAFDQQDNQREYTGYYTKKYTPMSNPDGSSTTGQLASDAGLNSDFQISQDQDYVSIRYADVLLMAAELGSGNAQAYFDAVRQRAYKTNFTPLVVNPANLKQERYFEFALEGIRYWDLLRYGINEAAAAIAQTTPVLSGNVSEIITTSADKIIATKGLQQIPSTQITLSAGVLIQNPGW